MMKFNAPKNDVSYMMGGKMKYQEGGQMPEQGNPMEERVMMLQEAMAPFSPEQKMQIMDKIIESVSKMASAAQEQQSGGQGEQGGQMQSAQPQQMR